MAKMMSPGMVQTSMLGGNLVGIPLVAALTALYQFLSLREMAIAGRLGGCSLQKDRGKVRVETSWTREGGQVEMCIRPIERKAKRARLT